MTVRATHVVAPVFAAAEVVVLFPAGVAGEAGLGGLLGRLVLEGSDLRLVSVCLDVSLDRRVLTSVSFPQRVIAVERNNLERLHKKPVYQSDQGRSQGAEIEVGVRNTSQPFALRTVFL